MLASSNATDTSSYQADLVTESLLLDIAQQQEQLIAVGERGHIIHSSDGQTWQQDQVPTTSTLTAVSVMGNKTWVVGHDAVILYKETPASEWVVQQYIPELEKPLMDVVFFDDMHGIAIGAYGLFYRTTDGGKNWVKELHPEFLNPEDQVYLEEIRAEDEAFYREELASILPHLNRVSVSGNTVFLAGEAGLLAFSQDQGHSWKRMEINYFGSFFDIKQLADGSVYAAGLRGNVFQAESVENTWERKNTSSTASVNSIVPLTDGSAIMVGNNGTLICVSGAELAVNQTPEKQALVNAIEVNGTLVAVTAGGLKVFENISSHSPCNKDT